MTLLFLASNDQSGNTGGHSREDIPEQYRWDLTDLYQDKTSWEQAQKELAGDINQLENYQGTLTQSAEQLYGCLELSTNLYKKYFRLASYAYRLHDQDTRESGPQAMTQTMNQLGTKLSSTVAFIDPEILALDQETIQSYLDALPPLRIYKHYLDNIQRQKAHTLSSSEEKIISESGLVTGAPYDIYSIFKDADMPRPTVTSEDEEITLDDAAYTLHRANPNRTFRKEVFEKFFGTYRQYERTFGTELAAQVNRDLFLRNVRKYDSCLEHSLDANNIPPSVYHNLVKSVHQHLHTLHRYLRLRQRMLQLDTLHYYDLYAPLVDKVDLDYEVEEAQELIKEALAPLGGEYVSTLETAFNNRWIDMMPNPGKRSGAYSTGSAYDVHPYILMNFNGRYNDVSTLAHELGHTMHSFFSNKGQHFINAQYPIFLAEVASTTNEALLVDYMLQSIDDSRQRLSLLGNRLETLRTTLFRQTQFAEFELKIHEHAEQGQPLTGTALTELYLDILKTYYGDAEEVMVIDDLYGIEWAYVPHFYYNFYVYQYATSLCAATAISAKILSDGQAMRQQYIADFLSAGGSDYPIPILKRIGVDLTSPEPYDLTFKEMDRVIDEIEALLAAENPNHPE